MSHCKCSAVIQRSISYLLQLSSKASKIVKIFKNNTHRALVSGPQNWLFHSEDLHQITKCRCNQYGIKFDLVEKITSNL